MSQQLTITFRHKREDGMSIELAWWTTTPARDMAEMRAFPYAEAPQIVDAQYLKTAISRIEERAKEYQDLIEQNNKQSQEFKEVMSAAQTPIAFQSALEHGLDLQRQTNELRGDIYHLETYTTRLEMCADILENNKDDWELVYTNC